MAKITAQSYATCLPEIEKDCVNYREPEEFGLQSLMEKLESQMLKCWDAVKHLKIPENGFDEKRPVTHIEHQRMNIEVSLDHEKSFLLQDGTGSVQAIAFYQESLLLTSTNDVVQRDIKTGKIQRTFRGHTNQIYFVTVTEDFRMITSGWDDMIMVWDLHSATLMKRIWLGTSFTFVTTVAFIPNQVFTGGFDQKLRQVDLTTGRVLRTIALTHIISEVIVKNDVVLVGIEATSHNLLKLNIANLGLISRFAGHENSVTSLLLYEKLLFSGSADNTIICWDFDSETIIRVFRGHTELVSSLIIINDELYSGGFDRIIIKWNRYNGQIITVFPRAHRNYVRCLAHYANLLFSGSTDTTAIGWNLTAVLPSVIYKGRPKIIPSIFLWNNLVISGSRDSEVRLWDTSKNSLEPLMVLTENTDAINCLHLHNDILFSGSADNTIRQWNISGLSFMRVMRGHSASLSALTAGETSLFSGSLDAKIINWDFMTGNQVAEFSAHSFQITTLLYQDETVYSGSWDESIIAWDVKNSEILRTYQALGRVSVVQIVQDSIIAGTSTGLIKFLIATGEGLVTLQESFLCYSLESSEQRLYSAHSDSLIRSRDLTSLNILETFQGHFDSVLTIALDESGVMYSSGFDGSIKRWNMVSRKVAFSFELRSSSVTCLSTFHGILAIGMRSGDINYFNVMDATIRSSSKQHRGPVTSLIEFNGDLFSSGADGLLIKVVLQPGEGPDVIVAAGPMPINGAVLSQTAIIIISGDLEIRRYLTETSGSEFRKIALTSPLSCINANDNFLIAGTKSGQVLAWSQVTFEPASTLKGHTSEVNSVLIAGDALYSASDDKTIIKWSLVGFISLTVLKRYSASALGHLGPVTSLSLCDDVLFSGGSDSTVRRWNTQTGTHEDVYFGFSKSVTSVSCYNNSVFAGSEDFSVLMFRPEIKVGRLTSTIAASNSLSKKAKVRTKIFKSFKELSEDALQGQILIVSVTSGSVIATILMVVVLSCVYSKRKGPLRTMGATSLTGDNTAIIDLKTVVNSVMGISKHAAYLIESSAIAKVKKISAGGGGELFLVKIMDFVFSKKADEFSVQKIVFVNSRASEDAFYQEVGIMIMLSTFPNFCKIIAYTDKPLSLILKFYPDGSLMDWLAKNHASIEVIMKLMKEITGAIKVMHLYYLAHCDLKTANVLVEVVEEVPCCYLTDFGITQVLSGKIIASKAFKIINLRGLSVYYAAPDAFTWFRSKSFLGVDFKKFDIYSLACLVLELLNRKAPWG